MTSYSTVNLDCPDHRQQLVEHVTATLVRTFDASFDIWAREETWTCVTASESRLSVELGADDVLDVTDLLESAYRDHKPIVTNLSDGRNLLILPIEQFAQVPLVALGIVSGQTTDLLEKLATASLITTRQQRELEQQAHRMDDYVRQISHDFEELTWLRSLAELLDHGDATNEVEQIAQSILPSLSELISSEAIVFVAAERTEEAAEQRTASVGRPKVWSGNHLLNEHDCRRSVDHFREAASVQPVVNNQLSQLPEFSGMPAIKSCILVSVEKRNHRFGWLLALNKVERQRSADAHVDDTPNRLSENEFGTFEATLMSAAAAMLATHARNAELFREKEALLIGVVQTLVNSIDAKDAYTCGHSERVALSTKRLAEELGLNREQCEQIYLTGLLHDIGKIGVSDDVLLKPGKLTDEEFQQIKRHPEIGHSILKHLEQLSYVLPGVLHHHESINGEGYPHGLSGNDIPLFGRILAVTDAYDAMTSHRPYRQALPNETAESILREGAGKQWDAAVVDAFFSARADIRRICEEAEQQTRAFPESEHASDPGGEAHRDSIVSAITETNK